MPGRFVVPVALALACAAAPVCAAPPTSDAALAAHGGGCYPAPALATGLEALAPWNPEWAPVVSGGAIASAPVLVHGTVTAAHGDLGGAFPATHLRSDRVAQLTLDAADAARVVAGDPDGLAVAWEAGRHPAWAWPSAGDTMVALGRWVFDCARPHATPGTCSASSARACLGDDDCRPPVCPTCAGETCIGAQFGYQAEIHPPYAIATIRRGRGGVLSTAGTTAGVPVTRADVYVGGDGGGAGDRCVLTHQATDLLTVACFPLVHPVAAVNARNFEFDLPLPPRPSGGRPRWRVLPQAMPGGALRATVGITPRLRPTPRLHVKVRLKRAIRGALPAGYAGTILAGWTRDPTPLVHVRVTVQSLIVINALQPARPSVPRECATSGVPCDLDQDCAPGEACLGQGAVRSWRLQVAVNGESQEMPDLDAIDPNVVLDRPLVWNQWLPTDGALHVVAEGVAEECREARAGRSLAAGIAELGPTKLAQCLATHARDAGRVDDAYAGPDFGAAPPDGTVYETISTGGAGGFCSLTDVVPCVVDDDCPVAETCVATGGAFALRYLVERLP